jgi:Txe/YoeB family toxin of Txe-Axe toxin-antitoxin module
MSSAKKQYTTRFKPQFIKDVKKYASKKKQIEKKVQAIIEDPFHNTEPLEEHNEFDLQGIRSKRVDRNFRILFAVCGECRNLYPDSEEDRPCSKCAPEFDDDTIIFYVVRPHKIVYKTKKPLE